MQATFPELALLYVSLTVYLFCFFKLAFLVRTLTILKNVRNNADTVLAIQKQKTIEIVEYELGEILKKEYTTRYGIPLGLSIIGIIVGLCMI